MNTMRWTRSLAVGLLLMAAAAPAQNEAGGPVTLRTVKYADLAAEVTKHRGDVVVVDLWAFF